MKTMMNYIGFTTLSIPVLLVAIAIGSSSWVFAGRDGIYTPHDIDRDGFLDQEEFKLFIEKRRLKPEHVHLWIFDAVDKDKDGKISQEEIINSLNQEMMLRLNK